MDNRTLAILNQKNKVSMMEQNALRGAFAHPHDRISYRLDLLIERAKLGLLITSKN